MPFPLRTALYLVAGLAFLAGVFALFVPTLGAVVAFAAAGVAVLAALWVDQHDTGTAPSHAAGARRGSRRGEPVVAERAGVGASSVPPSRSLAGYERIEKLGEGSMGDLWLVRHLELGRNAVLKEIRGTHVDEEDIGRFRREARVLSQLHCPHTIQVYDYGVGPNGQPYYVMEYLKGIDLQALVTQRGPLPAARVVSLLRQICLSLDEAHQAGLVHRDIKPANVMVCHYGNEWDFCKLLDFGLVKRDASSTSVAPTRPAVVLGTPAYVAPESLRGSKFVDGRADLYAVGAVGYFLLTGRLLFDHDQPIAMAKAHLSEPAPRASDSVSLPKELDDLLHDCLQKDPAQRPQTAKQLAQRLDAIGGVPWSQEQAAEVWRDYGPLLHGTPADR